MQISEDNTILFLNVNFDFITQTIQSVPCLLPTQIHFLFSCILSLIFISCYVPNIITTFVASFLVFFFAPRIFNVVIEQQRQENVGKKFMRKKETFETQNTQSELLPILRIKKEDNGRSQGNLCKGWNFFDFEGCETKIV
jgi:hypothetical protein